jgi:hypothetical protein
MEIEITAASEFLAGSPSLEEIIVFRPSEALQAQIRYLLEKNHTQDLTAEEDKAWQQYEELENRVRIAKAKALIQLQQLNV